MRYVFLVTVSALGLSAGAAVADWTGQAADQVASHDDDEYARGVQFVVDEYNELLYTYWAEDAPTTREIHFGSSADMGTTWSSATSDRVISFPDGNAVYEEPAVAVDRTGEIFVAWSEDHVATREVHVSVSTDAGVTFSSETADLLASDATTAADTGIPSLAIDSEGVVHVVWQQSLSGGPAEVHYSRSTDLGATWTGTSGDRVISFPDGGGAITPKILVGRFDRLVVVWRENDMNGDPRIHLGVSTDGGDSWSSETADQEISTPSNIMTNLDAAALPGHSSSPELYVVYTASFDTESPFHYEVYATSSMDNGDTWSGETALIPVSFDEDHTRSASNPDVYFSGCGKALAAWNENDDVAGTAEQHVSVWNGLTWTGATADEVISFPDGENGYRPSIGGLISFVVLPGLGGRAGSNLDTWVAWTEFSGGATDNYEIHLSATQLCPGSGVPESGPEVSDGEASRLRVDVFPNPSSASVALRLSSEFEVGPAQIEVFDASGRSVRDLRVELDTGGRGQIVWDGADANGRRVAAGMYQARVSTASRVRTVPIVLF